MSLTQPLRVDDQCKVLLVQNPVQLLERRVQRDLLEGDVGGLHDGVRGLDLAAEDLGLQAAQGGHAQNLAKEKVHAMMHCTDQPLTSW